MSQVVAAKRVVLVGGGPSGVEVAGEIATDFPDKTITLIHGSSILCSPDTTHTFQSRVKQILKQLGVRLILGGYAKKRLKYMYYLLQHDNTR